MSNLRTLLLTIVAVVLTVVFLVWVYGVTHSGVNSAQLGLMQGAQALIGASPNAVQVGVNDGNPTVTVAPATITGVTWNTTTWSPSFTVNGYNFGTSGALTVADNTAGWTASTGGVKPVVSARSNLSIQVSGLSGYGSGDVTYWVDGQGSWSFRPNDQLTFQVANNQTGQTASFNTTYPGNAPMPTITMNPNPLPPMTTDGTVNLSGQVAFNGTPLANQAVDLTATGGSFSSSSGQTVADNSNVFMTFTDANGNWSATYTAPTTAGNDTITASTAGQSVSESTTATNPTVLLTTTTPLYVGDTEVITGAVTVGGSPDGGVSVALSVPSGEGTFSLATITTNGNGDFSDTYTAPATGGTFTLSAMSGGVTGTAPIVVEPLQITGVTWNTSTWSPDVTITGGGFGNSASGEYVQLVDNTHGWQDGTANSGNVLTVSTWNNNQIDITGMSNYGENGQWILAPGDSVTANVTNPQTGQTVSYTTTYPTNAPMPTVTLSPVAAINTGQSTTITGNVSFGGKGLANQQVNLTASGGPLSASTVQTDANGNFSVTYTAPNAGGSYTVTASSDTGSVSTTVTVNNPPQITGVSWNTGTWPPQLTISGTNLGTTAGNVELYDANGSPSWWDNTGHTGPAMNPANSGAATMNANWSNSSIGLSNYELYGQNTGWRSYFTPGDSLEVFVETSSGQTASYQTTYPSNAPMPVVTLNGIASVQTGQSTTISGAVTWQGQALNNALVTLSTSGGSLNSTQVATNSAGQFSAAYTAPSTAGTYTIHASSFTSSTSTNVTVTSPMSITSVGVTQSIQAPPQFTIAGTGFGNSTSGEYVQLVDNSRGWQGGTTNSGVILTVPTWNNNQIDISNESNYGGGSGTWLFAPGDSVTANVTNPQTGQTASYTFAYPQWNQTLVNYGGVGSGTQSSFAGNYGQDGIGGNTASGGTLNSNGTYWFAQERAIDVGQTVTAPLTVVVGGWATVGSGITIQTSTDGVNWAFVGYAPILGGGNFTYSFGTQTFRYVRAMSYGTTSALDYFEIY